MVCSDLNDLGLNSSYKNPFSTFHSTGGSLGYQIIPTVYLFVVISYYYQYFRRVNLGNPTTVHDVRTVYQNSVLILFTGLAREGSLQLRLFDSFQKLDITYIWCSKVFQRAFCESRFVA